MKGEAGRLRTGLERDAPATFCGGARKECPAAMEADLCPQQLISTDELTRPNWVDNRYS